MYSIILYLSEVSKKMNVEWHHSKCSLFCCIPLKILLDNSMLPWWDPLWPTTIGIINTSNNFERIYLNKERSWISARPFPTEESNTYIYIYICTFIQKMHASPSVVNALKRAGCRTRPPQIAVTRRLCHARWKSLDDVADKKCWSAAHGAPDGVHESWGALGNLNSDSHRIHGTGIFTCMCLMYRGNVGRYTIHGFYGIVLLGEPAPPVLILFWVMPKRNPSEKY